MLKFHSMKVELQRLDQDYHLQATNEDGQTTELDGSPAIGGHNLAMRPMQLLLTSLAGCSAIDIISLLRKQRQALDDIKITVEGERAEGIPAVFTKIHVHYRLYGHIDPKKAERACAMSMEKLCSVGMMLKASVEITWGYEILEAQAPAPGILV